jgi:rare lipoprotein A
MLLATMMWMALQVVVDSDVAPPAEEVGLASHYAKRFEGRRTASGERYRGAAATCAHRTQPFGIRLRVTIISTGKSTTCVVNDRGPHRRSRVIDVSRSVAAELGLLRRGLAKVSVSVEPSVALPVETVASP